MDLEQLNDIFSSMGVSVQWTSNPVAVRQIITALLLSTIVGWYLAFVYHYTYTGRKENRGQMVYTLVLLCLGGALVWLIVAENIVRAFGLAGALAMIRYRTRMQDPKDTTMVFFAIILGMACGLHQYFIAIFGAAFIGLVLWMIKLVNDHTFLSRPRNPSSKNSADSKSPPELDTAVEPISAGTENDTHS